MGDTENKLSTKKQLHFCSQKKKIIASMLKFTMK